MLLLGEWLSYFRRELLIKNELCPLPPTLVLLPFGKRRHKKTSSRCGTLKLEFPESRM
jgi:hypothetical protein